MTAERKVEEFIAGRGVVVRWEQVRKQNHWLDALYNACAAGHFCGARLVDQPNRKSRERLTLQQMQQRAMETSEA